MIGTFLAVAGCTTAYSLLTGFIGYGIDVSIGNSAAKKASKILEDEELTLEDKNKKIAKIQSSAGIKSVACKSLVTGAIGVVTVCGVNAIINSNTDTAASSDTTPEISDNNIIF
jgi:hypothetical protein